MKYKIININDISNDEYKIWYSFMDKEKKNRVNRFRLDDDKKRTIAGDMLARTMIAEECNLCPDDIIFDKNEYGKPFAKDLPIEFNISHSTDLVVCAVYDSAIGVDIEKIRPVNVNVINKVCNKQELEYIYSGKEKMSERFFEIWTFKEACFKRIGTGITDFESISYFDSYNNKKMFALDDYVLYVVY